MFRIQSKQVGAVFERFVFEPEDVEVELVALQQVVIIVNAPATLRVLIRPRRRPFVSVLWIIASDEIVKVGAFERVLLESEMLVGAKIVNPKLLCPGFLPSMLCYFAAPTVKCASRRHSAAGLPRKLSGFALTPCA